MGLLAGLRPALFVKVVARGSVRLTCEICRFGTACARATTGESGMVEVWRISRDDVQLARRERARGRNVVS
jgi:hypothetical protein